MRKNKQRWEYEEEHEYGARSSNDVEKRKVRRGQRRAAAVYDDMCVLPDEDEDMKK